MGGREGGKRANKPPKCVEYLTTVLGMDSSFSFFLSAVSQALDECSAYILLCNI